MRLGERPDRIPRHRFADPTSAAPVDPPFEAPRPLCVRCIQQPVPAIVGTKTDRHPSYHLVAGIDLRREMERLRALRVFARGPLARSAPELKVRRARRRPNRLGFAVPNEWRLSVTAHPEIRPGDVLETLLHELVHLHVGRRRGGRAWHGPAFKRTLARAMAEAYGIVEVRPRSTLHGAYAEALEERRLREGEQLRLEIA